MSTDDATNAHTQAEEAAKAAMAEIMAENTKYLTEYLRLHAQRVQAETALETLAKEEWTAWRALISPSKGGFSEAKLKRQAITAPAPVPRRDRGKSKRTSSKSKPVQTPATEQDNGSYETGGQAHYGG